MAEVDDLLEKAKSLSREIGFVNTSMLQRGMRIGYMRAARLAEMMVEDGFCEKAWTDGYRKLIPQDVPVCSQGHDLRG